MSVPWEIPPSLVEQLRRAPLDKPVVLLLRHSVRDDLPDGDAGYVLPITDIGQRLAEQLGRMLGHRLQSLHSSPLVRCIQTAEGLRHGAGVEIDVKRDRLLGDPGAFVIDGGVAQSHWVERGHEGVMERLVAGDGALTGMAEPSHAARFLVQHMLCAAKGVPGIHVFVTHDSLITATAARVLGRSLGPEDWPWYLEAAAFWEKGDAVNISYRDHTSRCATPLCGLDDGDVVEFARREIGSTVGLACDARFFLAGGAFKTLLSGRAPRDIDLWAPSVADREQLVRALVDRGAQQIESRPFTDVFTISDRTVDVPHKVEPGTLEARLQRFDLALSAVGVEHLPGGEWRAVVHPLANESARRREILLLKPLVNWKYALATLERARRYAEELSFTVPAEEEEEVWDVFSKQAPDMRQGMIERHMRTSSDEYGVLKEALCRFP